MTDGTGGGGSSPGEAARLAAMEAARRASQEAAQKAADAMRRSAEAAWRAEAAAPPDGETPSAEPVTPEPVMPEPVSAEPETPEPVMAEPVMAEPVMAESLAAAPPDGAAEPLVLEPPAAAPEPEPREVTGEIVGAEAEAGWVGLVVGACDALGDGLGQLGVAAEFGLHVAGDVATAPLDVAAVSLDALGARDVAAQLREVDALLTAFYDGAAGAVHGLADALGLAARGLGEQARVMLK